MQYPSPHAPVEDRCDAQHSTRNRANRRTRPTSVVALLALIACGLLPAMAQANTRQSSIGIRMTILPAAEVATLPPPVQRLESVMPGYGDHWTHARNLAATDPLHAVRTLRAVHQRARDHHGADAWLDDMVTAGQGLFADQDMPLFDDLVPDATGA